MRNLAGPVEQYLVDSRQMHFGFATSGPGFSQRAVCTRDGLNEQSTNNVLLSLGDGTAFAHATLGNLEKASPVDVLHLKCSDLGREYKNCTHNAYVGLKGDGDWRDAWRTQNSLLRKAISAGRQVC